MNEVPNEFSLTQAQPSWRDPRGFIRTRPLLALIIALVLLAIVVGIVLIVRHSKNVTTAEAQRRAGAMGSMAVAVATATSGEIAANRPALGTVTPLATVTVDPDHRPAAEIGFTEGQLVTPGTSWRRSIRDPTRRRSNRPRATCAVTRRCWPMRKLDLKRYERS